MRGDLRFFSVYSGDFRDFAGAAIDVAILLRLHLRMGSEALFMVMPVCV